MDIIHVLARICVPILFIVSGYSKLMNVTGISRSLAVLGIPQPTIAGYAIAALELVAGLMVLVGFKTRWAALALFVFTGLTIVMVHHFWSVPAAEFVGQRTQALKNLSIMSALLMFVVHGAGKLSLDGRSR